MSIGTNCTTSPMMVVESTHCSNTTCRGTQLASHGARWSISTLPRAEKDGIRGRLDDHTRRVRKGENWTHCSQYRLLTKSPMSKSRSWKDCFGISASRTSYPRELRCPWNSRTWSPLKECLASLPIRACFSWSRIDSCSWRRRTCSL